MEPDNWESRKTQATCSRYMLENEIHCDVSFRVGRDGELFRAHKLILAQRTAVFDRMLFGSDVDQKTPILIPDIEPAAFRAILRYCYYDCTDIDPVHALSTLSAAQQYSLPALAEASRTTVKNNLSPDNIWGIYASSLSQNNSTLLEACRRYFCQGVTAVESALESPTFLDVKIEVIVNLLHMNDKTYEVIRPVVTERAMAELGDLVPDGDILTEVNLHERGDGQDGKDKPGTVIAEIKLFRVLDNWAEVQCGRRGIDVSGPNKRLLLGDALHLVRFPTMLCGDIVNTVHPTEILTRDEEFDLLEHAHADSAYRAPPPFLATKHHYLVEIAPGHGATCYREYSPFLKSEAEYCSLDIVPKQRMLLSGIQHKCFAEPHVPAEHEVSVFENSKEKAWCNAQTSIIVDSDTQSCFYFEMEEILLEADSTYVIKVQVLRNSRASGEFFYRELKEFFYDKKKPEDLTIEVTKADHNASILGLRVRLV